MTDGLAGRLDDRGGVAAFNPYRTLNRDGSTTRGYAERPVVDALRGPTGNKEPLVVQSLDTKRGGPDDNEAQAGHLVIGDGVSDDLLLPLGLDSHRYRCCGNGVVSNVAEWIGWRLRIAA